MLPVLDNALMRDADRHTIETLGVPGLVLMENAATCVVDAIRDEFPEARRVLVLCGSGNNGGDGLVVARHLHNQGFYVDALVFAKTEQLSPDARKNFDIAKAFGVPLSNVVGDDVREPIETAFDGAPVDVVVDALLGTGLDRPLAGRLAQAVEHIASEDIPVVAVDVPTGLSGSSGVAAGPVLSAELTVTFAALKQCHVLPPASLHCGDVAVVDIGIPPQTLEQDCRTWLLEDEDITLLLPMRPPDGHKGTFGHLLIVAGAKGRAGAVAMAGRAAVVAGAGLVTMAVPEPAVATVDGACLEAMTHSLAADQDGFIAGYEGLQEVLGRKAALAVGPGLGTGEGAKVALEWILDNFSGPLLLDADAINLLAGRPDQLAGRDFPSVLTPHPGELARLLGKEVEEILADRLATAVEAASLSQSVVVSKGYQTIIADPSGEAWICPVGDSHLGSGGSGDVLTGTIGAFLAQGLEPLRAALVGCYLHGMAAELAAEVYPAAVPAAELPAWIAEAWIELEDAEFELDD
ncbi:MAG: NAD(P)H-hydrate dehydratase [bacterium]|nr:NAD(P)H-hydrate dehydratase [bacterium]